MLFNNRWNNPYNQQMPHGHIQQGMNMGRQVMQSNNMSQNRTRHSLQQMPNIQQGRQMSQMPAMPQMQQMPQMPTMPQMQQMPHQVPQMPSGPQTAPPAQTPLQNRQDQNNSTNQSNPFDKLKNIGTFMGYPEYTLSEYDPPENTVQLPQTHEAAAVTEPPPVSPYNDRLREISQNERNGSEFYTYLAATAQNEKDSDALKSIAERAVRRSNRLIQWHNSLTKSDFVPEERNIRKDIGFFEGIDLAIREESGMLKSCAELAESMHDDTLRERLNSIILEKLCQINELNVLKRD